LRFTDDECPGKKGERIRGRKKLDGKKQDCGHPITGMKIKKEQRSR